MKDLILDKKMKEVLDFVIQLVDNIRDDQWRFEALLSIISALKKSDLTGLLNQVNVKALSILDGLYESNKNSLDFDWLVYFAEQYLKLGKLDKARVFIERAKTELSELDFIFERLEAIELILSKIDSFRDVDHVFSLIKSSDFPVSAVISALSGKLNEAKDALIRRERLFLKDLRGEIRCAMFFSMLGEFDMAKEIARSIEVDNLRLKAFSIIAEKQLEVGLVNDAKATIREALKGEIGVIDSGYFDLDRQDVSLFFFVLNDLSSLVNVSVKLGMIEEARKLVKRYRLFDKNISKLEQLPCRRKFFEGVNLHLEVYAELLAKTGMMDELRRLVDIWRIPFDVEVLKFEFEKEMRESERRISRDATSIECKEYLRACDVNWLTSKFVRYVRFFARLAVAFIRVGKISEGKLIFQSLLELVKRIISFPINKRVLSKYFFWSKKEFLEFWGSLTENRDKLVLAVAEAQALAGLTEEMMELIRKVKDKLKRFEFLLSIAENLVSSGMLSEGIKVAEKVANVAIKLKNDHCFYESVRLFSKILKEIFILKQIRA
mgnify:CR=1 FL=1